jgi:phosphate transport system substrate-binding protein
VKTCTIIYRATFTRHNEAKEEIKRISIVTSGLLGRGNFVVEEFVMRLPELKRLLPIGCWLLAGPAFAWQVSAGAVKRLYVEPFATKTDADKLHDDVTEELRKQRAFTLVRDEANADLILGGGGEIWIRGYHSFSPRSHIKMPSNGTPIYGGYLSVELRNRQGVTEWSYLATPGAASEDVPKDLSKRIAKHLVEAHISPEIITLPPSPHRYINLSGAGATFPYPVYEKWFTNFQNQNPGVAIKYDAIGSEAGIRRLLTGSIDFGASDNPDAIHELAPDDEKKFLLFPSVVGAVVPIVNLPGVSESIAFTPETLAGIYLGKIRRWNDPIIKRANRGVNLPDLDIVVVHRADGSGTSYAWTDYLSKTNPEWRAAVGVSLSPKWSTGRAATGNDGVARLVKELGGSIGYVEFIYALRNHLNSGRIQNRNGEFVEASLESIDAAVSHSSQIRDDFKGSIVDAPGEGSYPIASFTWIVVPTHIADDAKRSAITTFMKWMLGPGQRQAAALGYLALPKEIVTREDDVIAKIR